MNTTKKTVVKKNKEFKNFNRLFLLFIFLLTILSVFYLYMTWSTSIAELETSAKLQAEGIVFAAFLLAIAFYLLLRRNFSLKQVQKRLYIANDEAKISEQKALDSRNEMAKQSGIQQILLDISADFANIDFHNITQVIDKSLEKIGNAVHADRVYIFRYDFTAQFCKNTFEWCAQGTTPQIDNLQNVPLALMNDWPNTHIEGKSVVIPNVLALPEDNSLRMILEPQGIKSLLAVPIMLGNKCFGFTGFDFVKNYHTYTEKEQRLLEQCGNMLVSTFSRVKIATELSKSEEKYRNMFEYSPIGVFNFDLKGLIIECNDFFVNIIGSSRSALIGLNLHKLPDLKIVECIQGALLGKITEYNDVYHSVTSDKVTPIRAKFSPILSQENEIIGGTGIIEDVTERKKLRDELLLKSLLLEQLEEQVTITDLDGVITYVNQAQVFEKTPDRQELVGQKSVFFDKDNNQSTIQNDILEKTLNGGLWRGNVVNLADDGSEVILNCRTQVVCDENGTPIALAAIASDITARKKMESDLYNEKETFKTTLLSVGDGVISTDAQGKVVLLNKIAEQYTGWTQEDAYGKPLEEVFNIINEYTRKKCENPVFKVLKTEKIIELANHTALISRTGTERFIEDSAAPIKNEQGIITGVVLVFRDFTEKKQKQEEIEYLGYHDQLTGLYNRRYYEKEVLLLDNEMNYPLTLLMVDVNGLKLTNDAFGHDSGDLVLQRIANILANECRENDIAARIGGDEFVVLLPKADTINAKETISRINTAISNEQFNNLVLSVSVGYAVKENTFGNMNEIFMQAEDSMYRHKLSESLSMRSKTIDLIMRSLFEKNNREMMHSKRVGEICEALAKAMNFSKDDINQMRIAGLMHDIGKIGISEEVLNKPANLNLNEWNELERHSEIGYRILSSVSEFSKIADYVLEHHEKLDGSGYPRGLRGQAISMQARIITLSDAYDAMTSERPYKKCLSKQQAIDEIKKCSGSQFDPDISKIFVQIVLKDNWD
ncbi:MAG: PAS domain S-box protein [Eubacteriales bacterium]